MEPVAAEMIARPVGEIVATGADFVALRSRFFAWLDVSPKTAATYSRALAVLFRHFADNGIGHPTRADVLAWREGLRIRNLSPATIQAYIIAARRFFAWTAAEGIYPNVAEAVKGARVVKLHKRDYLAADAVRLMLSRVDRATPAGRRRYALLAAMVTLGLRDVEAARANVGDLRAAGGQSVLYVQGKGRADRAEFVRVPAETERALREYLADRPDAADETAPLFAAVGNRNRGGRLTTHTISAIVKDALRAAGYNSPRLTAHSLRHTAVTLALLGGATLQEASAFARHSNIATTQIYAHNLDAAANPCAGNVAAAVFGGAA